MTLVDWSQIIAPDLGAKVLFSALALPPHKDKVDANLVAIELPGGLFIDVEFTRVNGQYTVTLYRDDIDNPMRKYRCVTSLMVPQVVAAFAESTRIYPASRQKKKKSRGNTYMTLAGAARRNTARVVSASHGKRTRPLELV